MSKPPPRRFAVIDGTPAPETPVEGTLQRLRKQPRPPSLVRCPHCTSAAVLEIKIGVELRNGKPRGGQKQLICAPCFARGETRILY